MRSGSNNSQPNIIRPLAYPENVPKGEDAMAFWIFKCNPEKYRFAERASDPNPNITWTASQHTDEIGPGDTAFIWETGPNRGIRAVIQIESAPEMLPELPTEQSYWTEPDTDIRRRVLATLTHRGLNVSHLELRSIPGLEKLSVFHGFQQATNFRVTPEEGAILMRLIDPKWAGQA
jgi:EVE domain